MVDDSSKLLIKMLNRDPRHKLLKRSLELVARNSLYINCTIAQLYLFVILILQTLKGLINQATIFIGCFPHDLLMTVSVKKKLVAQDNWKINC